jgi:hypothetical protein
LLEKEEKAEAARQELEWQSRLNRDKLDVNFRDPDVDEDGEDEGEGPEEVPRKAQKRLRGVLPRSSTTQIELTHCSYHVE